MPVPIGRISKFVEANIQQFHDSRYRTLERLDLRTVLRRKNPYLFKAKHLEVVTDLITSILDAYLSSSEEGLFGEFLEKLALFVAESAWGAQKSSTAGIDIDLSRDETRYLVSVKSGKNWGNSSQQRKLKEDFDRAVRVVKQIDRTANVEAVLGACYGPPENRMTNKGFLRISGKEFWEFIGGEPDLYTDIVEPLGHKAKLHNDKFAKHRAHLLNRLTQEFITDFCDDGKIDWKRLVQFNSGGLKLARR